MRVKILHLLCFFLCFILEVRLKAEAVLEEPRACLNVAETDCALRADGAQYHYMDEIVSFAMTPDSIIMREESGSKWRFVDGTLWVKELAAGNELDFEIGKIKSVGNEKISLWLIGPVPTDLGEQGWMIRVVKGEAALTRADGHGLVTVPAGFQITAQGYNISGQLIRSIPQPIDFPDHLKLWGQLQQGTKAEFLSEALEFRKVIREAIETSSLLYTEVIERKVAATQERKARSKRLRAQRKAEQQEVLELFKRRNYMEHLD